MDLGDYVFIDVTTKAQINQKKFKKKTGMFGWNEVKGIKPKILEVGVNLGDRLFIYYYCKVINVSVFY